MHEGNTGTLGHLIRGGSGGIGSGGGAGGASYRLDARPAAKTTAKRRRCKTAGKKVKLSKERSM